MYVITIENEGAPTVIHDGGVSDLKVDSAGISQEKNQIESLTFTIYPFNPGYNLLVPFKTLVRAYNTLTQQYEFEGRVLQPSDNMDSSGIVSKTVVCEGPLGFLCDSTQSYLPEEYYGDANGLNGLQNYLKKLLDVHNSKVEEFKRIYLGNVTLQTFDTSTGVTKGISRGSTWDNINDKLIDVFGGEMRVRKGSDGLLYLDYAESLGTTRSTRIAIGRNMEDGSREIDPNSVITRLYPYGAKIKRTETDEEGNETEVETEERITIETVNGGVPYIDDAVAIEQYGIIEGYQEWDDVTLPQNLLTKAREWLGSNNAMPVSHKFTAVDLSLLGMDYDSFTLYDKYPCYNPLIGVDETLEIVKRDIDINEPDNSTIEMGDTTLVLSGGDLILPDIKEEFEDFKSQTNTNITNVNNAIKSTQASIKVFEDRIEQSVQETVESTSQKVVQEEIKKVTVGSRNLVLNSRKEESSSEYGFAESDLSTALTAGESYVFSANGYISQKTTEDNKTLIVKIYGSDGLFSYSLEFDTTIPTTKRVIFVAPEGIEAQTVKVAAYYSPEAGEATGTGTVNWYKLERGTIGTDWTPAPEDAESSIADVNDLVNETADAIGGEIAELGSTIQGAEERVNESLALIEENATKITELIQTADGFTFNFQQITETVTELNNQITTEYSERLKYIKFVDGEIWLGKDPEPNENDFKVVITNERIRFLQNNIEVAYMSNNKLYITNASITNRLELGNYVFYPRSNGNLTLRFFGDE